MARPMKKNPPREAPTITPTETLSDPELVDSELVRVVEEILEVIFAATEQFENR
jgi:hypothetical protein